MKFQQVNLKQREDDCFFSVLSDSAMLSLPIVRLSTSSEFDARLGAVVRDVIA